MRGCGGFGVAQQGEQRAVGVGIDQRGKQPGGVRAAASARIVLRVGQNDGLVGGRPRGTLDSLGRPPQASGERGSAAANLAQRAAAASAEAASAA